MKILILIACIYVSNAQLNNTVTISNGDDFFLFWESSLAEVNKSNQFPDAISDLIGDLPESDYWYFYNQIGSGDIWTKSLDVTGASYLCIEMKFFIINVEIWPIYDPDIDPITDNSIPGHLNTFVDCIEDYLEYGFAFMNMAYPPLNIFILKEVIMWSDGPNFPNYPDPPSTTTEIPSTEMTTDSSTESTTTDSESTITTTAGTTTSPPTFVCSSAGFFADPSDCTKYYRCLESLTAISYICPPTTHWSQSAKLCVEGPCETSNTTTTTN